MDIQKLVRMANQIEGFFRAESDPEDAVAGIENHLKRFWDPRMRVAIVAHCAQGGAGLGDLAKRAVMRLAPSPGGGGSA